MNVFGQKETWLNKLKVLKKILAHRYDYDSVRNHCWKNFESIKINRSKNILAENLKKNVDPKNVVLKKGLYKKMLFLRLGLSISLHCMALSEKNHNSPFSTFSPQSNGRYSKW